MTREKQNEKKRWAIKSGNGHKNPWDPFEKVRDYGGKDLWKR